MIEIPYLLQSFMQVLPTGFKNRCVVLLSFVSLCKEGWVGGNDLGSLYPNSSKKKIVQPMKKWIFLNELLNQFIKFIYD